MNLIGFWILEDLSSGDLECTRIKIFRSYQSLVEFVRSEVKKSYDEDEIPMFVDSKDEDGYFRTLIYLSDDGIHRSEEVHYAVHRGSLTKEA